MLTFAQTNELFRLKSFRSEGLRYEWRGGQA